MTFSIGQLYSRRLAQHRLFRQPESAQFNDANRVNSWLDLPLTNGTQKVSKTRQAGVLVSFAQPIHSHEQAIQQWAT